MYTLAEELSNSYDHFLRLSGSPDSFGKGFFLSLLNSPFLSFKNFSNQQYKQSSSISQFCCNIEKLQRFCMKSLKNKKKKLALTRGVSRTVATSKMERFVIIVNGFQLLTIITKRSILDVAAVLDPSLLTSFYYLS